MTTRLTLQDLDPDRLYVLVLGVGNAFTRTAFNSSFLLIAGGVVVAIDCPGPFGRVLHDAGVRSGLHFDVGDIRHIVLTHLHGDHCNGLEEVGYTLRYVLPGEHRAHLYLLPENVGPLWERRLSAVMATGTDPAGQRVARTLEDYFTPHPWEEDQPCRLAGADAPPLEFHIRRTLHPVPCFGFRVSYKGATLGYSADTPFDPKLLAFLGQADLLIHESSPGSAHTPLEALEALDASVRDRMMLIHLADETRERGAAIPALVEGALYEVGAGRSPIVPTRRPA